jgi:hypothetical protein
MKKIFDFFKNWFSKNGLIKILIAFVLLIIAVIVIRKTTNHNVEDVFTWVGYIAGGYIILTIVIFLIVGIVNSFKKP